ncbi:MAG: glutathione S-transferase family protein [Chloroflexota bacterium]
MLVLYHHNISVCAQKVRIALAEKKLAHERKHVHLMKAEQVSPEYLKINPKGVVPALVHDGQSVIESTVIMEYLDDAFPARPLRPAAPLARAKMRVWAQVPDTGIHAACATVSFAAAFAEQVKAANDPAALKERLAKLPDRARAWRQEQLYAHGLGAPFVPDAVKLHDKMLADMETSLAGSRWLASDEFSIADCAIVPYVLRLDRLGLAKLWDSRPRVADWYARFQARPSVSHNTSPRQ